MHRKTTAALAVIGALLVAPAFSVRSAGVGVPRIWDGDEPHYLVMIHSLVRDGDLDLANNYAASLQGGPEAGRRFAGQPLDHHVVFWRNGHGVPWTDVYSMRREDWSRDERGHPVPLLKSKAAPDVAGLPERSTHPFGLPLLMAAFTWPLRQTDLIEPACVLLSALLMVAAMLAFFALASRFTDVPDRALLVTWATFLGTPLWHYARSIDSEGSLTLLTLLACLLVVRGRAAVLAGVCVGLGTLMKPPFAIVALPLALRLWKRNERLTVLYFGTPVVLGAAAVLVSNFLLHGDAFASAQPFSVGNPFTATLGLLLDPAHGLLPSAPVALLALWGWGSLARKKDPDVTMIAGVGLLYFAVIALWRCWWGAWCYGPRLIVPTIPLVMLGLVACPALQRTGRGWRALIAVLLAVSVGLNARASFVYWHANRDLPVLFGPSPR